MYLMTQFLSRVTTKVMPSPVSSQGDPMAENFKFELLFFQEETEGAKRKMVVHTKKHKNNSHHL